ncbi:OmpA family protein [Ohtaekwangia koreensis]|uniref:OmpA family protein n=1 Tax=Ohtaekwangia koreensis TaxID=688867 RepID=A0A1T5LSA3_9BACT|nr:OmpA family protein [Ohtaekwangia koreensis]SKC78877.1 OmpA family protein [Ohtaekwangia koreensis]
MKKIAGYFLLLIALTSLSFNSFSQSKELVPGYYVVVSAYASSRENLAKQYVEDLKQSGIAAEYGFDSGRKLYFVYLKYFTSLKESLKHMSATRKRGKFTDAWVRVIPGYIAALQTTPPPPEVKTSTTPQGKNEEKNQTATPAKTEDIAAKEAPVDSAAEEVTENPPIVQHEVMTLGNTEVFLSLYNARNNRIVEGDVQVIDTERSRVMTRVKGNEYLVLPDPKSKTGQLTLICEAFGYRKVQQEINYPLPLADTIKPHIDLMGTTIVINFDLVRYHKGDIATLYNVYFYNDAAIMRPESSFELNSLLQLMLENPNYRIRLHGHTNGSYHGKVITMGPDKNFFSLDGSKQGSGSAKDLSYNRASVIKDYLISKGIAADRMELKAWGGKRPLYDKRSPNAQKNVRVEVEILEE